VATDSSGNIYVADTGNHIIRKITPAGVTSTLAGTAGSTGSADGAGSAARLYAPEGVATDSGGNIYVADTSNQTIRKITPGGFVTTLAGMAGFSGSLDGTGSAARFRGPGQLAADSGGNIYVADTFNHTVRKITPGAVVTTLAGMAASTGSADGTGSAARFYFPAGVTTDSGGNVYIADTDNRTIRRITAAGVVTTLAGMAGPLGSADGTGSAARFFSPGAVAADRVGNVYVADANNHTIRKITAAGVVTTFAGVAGSQGNADGTGSAARFRRPRGVAAGGDGNIYVADTENHTIRKITSTGIVTTLAGFAGSSGSADGTGSSARFFLPRGVSADSSGNAYVADSANHTIRKITPDGTATTVAGMAGSPGSSNGTASAARFNNPGAVAIDIAGNIYVADSLNHTLRLIPTSSGDVRTIAGMARLSGSADGTDSAARFNDPEGVATDSVNIYIADTGNHTIRKITIARVVTTLAGMPGFALEVDGTGNAARFASPTGLSIDRDENVFVADYGNNSIRRGEPALSDLAVIDKPAGVVGQARQLNTAPQTATSWSWRLVRQPSNSIAVLSSPSVRNPAFIPDVADLYVFQLTATNGVQTSITMVELTATTTPLRSRAVRR
jgi:sugar lactone lactonase YvrE